jgi:hypothetical protein
MPTDKECADWNKELLRRRFDYDGMFRRLRETWPEKADRMVFYDWLKKCGDKPDLGDLVSPEALKNRISNTAYNDFPQRCELWNLLCRYPVPCLPAGKDLQGRVYRIMVNLSGVRTNNNFYSDGSRSYAIAFPAGSCSSEDRQPEGFFFYGIGGLERWRDEPKEPEDGDSDWAGTGCGSWGPTLYSVVIRIDESGAGRGIYVLFNRRFPVYGGWAKDDYDLGMFSLDGIRDKCCVMFKDVRDRDVFAVKIADKVEELKFTRQFDFTETSNDPFDVVAVECTSEGTFAPATDLNPFEF